MKKLYSLLVISTTIFSLTSPEALSQTGWLDNTFGNGGKVITPISNNGAWCRGIVIQPDGKIVAAGTSYNGNNEDVAVARYNSDGILDNSFGNSGKVISDFGNNLNQGNAVVLQSDGKIVVAGYSVTSSGTIFNPTNTDNFALYRYNANGTLDNSFGNGGRAIGNAGAGNQLFTSVEIQSDGKIVAAGYYDNANNNNVDGFLVVRFNTDGTLDNSFGNSGIVSTNLGSDLSYAKTLAIQTDGKIVVAGYVQNSSYEFGLARYNSNGSLDNSFGNSGKVISKLSSRWNQINDITLQPDGKIIATSHVDSNGTCNVGLTRYNSNGSFDTTFGNRGTIITSAGKSASYGNSVALQSNGKIIVAASSNNDSLQVFTIVRYNNNGKLDTLFGTSGIIQTQMVNGSSQSNSVVIQSDGKIVAAGEAQNNDHNDFALARYIVSCTPPTISTNEPSTICTGTRVTLTASGADSYSWSDGITNGVSFTPSVGVHTYTVIGETNDGCSDTITTTITVNALPIVSATASNATVCAGSSTTLSAQGASSYNWSDGIINGQSFTPTSTKTYTVTGTDNNNCNNTTTTTVYVNDKPTVTAKATSNTLCNGGSVTLSGSGALSCAWSDGVSNAVSFTPTSTKTYTVTGTDANNCSDTDTITIIVHPNPVVSANASDRTVCNGSSVTLTGTSTTLSPPSNYTWSDGIIDGVSFTPTTTKTYTVTGSNQFGCSDSDFITISVSNTANNTTVSVTSSANTVCAGEAVTLTAYTTPPTNNTTYTWTDNVTNGVGFVPASTHTYTVTGRFEDGCSSSTTTVVTVNPLPVITINASDNAVCIGESITLSATTNPTNSQTNFIWSDNVVNGVAFDPVASKSYSVTATNQNNCSSVATVSVTVNPLPVVSAFANSNTVCEGASMFLSGKGAQSYTWSDGINDGVSFIINASQTYTVTGTDANGCVDRDTVFISVKPAPDVYANASDYKICLGDSVYVAATSDNPHYWSDNLLDSTEFAPTTTKTYTVSTTGNNNCLGWDTVTIHVYSFPLGGVIPSATDTLICKGNSITLSGAGADTYRWSGRVKNNVPFTPQRTTTYTLTGIVGNTCNNTTYVTVRVLNSPRVTALVYPSNAAVCYGEEVILKGSSPDSVTYSWSHGITDSVAFIPTQDETYTVTASNGTNCSSKAVKAVRVLPLPNVSAMASPKANICIGDSIFLYGQGSTTTPSGRLKYYWSDNLIDSTVIKPTTNYVYTVTGKDEFSCSDTAMIAITVIDCDTNIGVGINEYNTHPINIYPNPNTGNFDIIINDSNINSTYSIINELGQTVEVIEANNGNSIITISNLANGIYYLIGNNNDNRITHKIVVIK